MKKNDYLVPVTEIIPVQTEEIICASVEGEIDDLGKNTYNDPWA